MNCPKCGSTDISTERRINGNNKCNSCGLTWVNSAHDYINLYQKPSPINTEEILAVRIEKKNIIIKELNETIEELQEENIELAEESEKLKTELYYYKNLLYEGGK